MMGLLFTIVAGPRQYSLGGGCIENIFAGFCSIAFVYLLPQNRVYGAVP
jgi:hypothetical protein